MTSQIRAADHLIDQLIAQGTTHIFGVPGESYLTRCTAATGSSLSPAVRKAVQRWPPMPMAS